MAVVGCETIRSPDDREPPSAHPDPLHRSGYAPLRRVAGWALTTSWPFSVRAGPGYYTRGATVFVPCPRPARRQRAVAGAGSDFVTAPGTFTLFATRWRGQVALRHGHRRSWEFGAGSGALALQLLDACAGQGVVLARYTIVDLSATLKARQQAPWATPTWCTGPVNCPQMQGVVVGNEVLDAMPVKLLARVQGVWHERGVAWDATTGALAWADRATDLRPHDVDGSHDYLTELHQQGEAFVRTLGARLRAVRPS